MAQIPSTKALTESDGLNDYFNVNTSAKRLELPNGMTLVQYADAYSTPGLQLAGGNLAPLQSTSAPAVANAGTIATANIGISRVTPAGLVTAVILAPGTINGQQLWVVNEAAAPNLIFFDVAGTSNVADAINTSIPGLSACLFVWDSSTSLWYTTGQTVNGALIVNQSATAPAVANAGTITTTGVGVARVAPGGAVTGIILQSGVVPGQSCWVINEAAGANSITFAASGTSHVADGVSDVLAGLTARLFIWDSVTALWYKSA